MKSSKSIFFWSEICHKIEEKEYMKNIFLHSIMKISKQYWIILLLCVLVLLLFYVKPVAEKFQARNLENDYHDEELDRLRAAVSSQL